MAAPKKAAAVKKAAVKPKAAAEASSLRTFRAGERPASRMKVASLKVPENDKQGYGYGRGKGTPTFNMKKSGVAASLLEHRAGERASAQKITGRSTATSVKRKAPGLMAPPKKGATVGDAMWAVNRGIQGALKASPGLKSKGIQNVMKLPPKRK